MHLDYHKRLFPKPEFQACTDDNSGIFWLLATGFTKPTFLHSPLNLAHPQPRLRLKDIPAQTAGTELRPWLQLGRTGLFFTPVHFPATGPQSKQQLCFRRIEEPSVSTLLFSCPYHHCLSSPRRSEDISRPGDTPESWHGLPKTKLPLLKGPKSGP